MSRSIGMGALRHRIRIESSTIEQSDSGAEDRTWAELATVWADVRPLSGREYLEGRRLETMVDTKIRIRFRSDIMPGHRVIWDGKTLDIVSVIEQAGDRREIHLMCKEWGIDR